MYKKLLSIVLIVSSTLTTYGQDLFHKISLDNKTSINTIENAHIIRDKTTNYLYAFMEESKTTYGYLYNIENAEIGRLVSSGLKRKYKEIIGQAITDQKVRLIQKNNRGTKYASILYDFKNNKTIEEEYDLDMKNQAFLQTYSYEDTCYLFTINKTNGTIRKWTLAIDGSHSYLDIDLSEEFKRTKFKANNLYSVMSDSKGFNTSFSVQKVENNVPNSLEVATQKNKMYEQEQGFILTLDYSKHRTVLLEFKGPELQPELKLIPKPKPLNNDITYKSNSFIIDNIIAQIVSNNKMMNIEIKDLNTLEIIKQYTVEKDDPIDFRNSDILQEGSMYSFGATRKMEKTSKFLRKISTDKNGIVLYKTYEGYRAIIGGTRQQSNGGGFAAAGFGAIPVGSIGAVTVSFNPTAFAYGAYSSTGSTRVECLFNDDFEHIPGELNENVFDQISAFKKDIQKRADNVFYIDGLVLFGNYNPSRKQYNLYSF